MLLMPTATNNRAVIALRRRMKDVELTQSEFALRIGRVQGWISSRLFIDPDSTLRHLAHKEPDVLGRLLHALKWTLPQLNTATGLDIPLSASDIDTDAVVPLGRQVPVYLAGTGPAWDLDDAVDIVSLPADFYPEKDVIGLKAMGDSMAPYLRKGDIAVVILDDGMVQPGDNCGVRMADDGVVIKRFVGEQPNGEITLESINPPQGEPRIFSAPLGSRVMGKVMRRILND